jgi:hypothetical protein
MRSKILFLGLLFVVVGLVSSCGLADEGASAEVEAAVFHNHMKKNNHDAMVKMLSDEALLITPEEEWRSIFQRVEATGKIKSIEKKTGFNTKINNGVSTVELNYTITFENSTVNEQLILTRKGEEKFKVAGIQFE